MDILSSEVIVILGAIAANILLGAIVWNYGPRTNVRIYFAQFIFVQILWIVANYISFHVVPEHYLTWTRITMLFAGLHVFFFYQIVYTFLRKKDIPHLAYSILVTLLLGISVLSLTPYVFSHIEVINGNLVPVTGSAIPLFGLFVALLVILALTTMVRTYNIDGDSDQARWRYMSMGLSLTILLVVVFSFGLFIISSDLTTVQFGHLYTLPFVIFTAYAMIRHQLFDIRPLVARALSFMAFIAIIAALYSAVLFFGATYFFNTELTPTDILMNISIVTIITLTFPALRSGISRLTEAIFYKGSYKADKLLSDLSHIMARTLLLDDMADGILSLMTSRMKVTKAALFIVVEHSIIDIKHVGYSHVIFDIDHIRKLLHKTHPQAAILFRETRNEKIKSLMRDYDIAVLIPMHVAGDLVGYLAVGPKMSGEVFYKEDLSFLDLLASEAGIAIKNAHAYEQIKEFSAELEEKVEERTKELKVSRDREVAKAKAVAQLKDEFVFVATHELRTPVTAIKGFLELVDKSKKQFPKDVQSHLNAIAMASGNLSQLVNDLLEISRSDAGKLEVEVVPIDITSVIRSVVQVTKTLADQKKVKITIKRHKKIPPVLADEKRLREVVTNLVSNAIKYNKEGGLIDISLVEVGETVLVEVRDTGFGIPKKEQKKIGDKFFRAVTRDTKTVIGTGLGLFITRMLIEKMGGKLEFSSVEGEGSTFAFTLEVAQDKIVHAKKRAL